MDILSFLITLVLLILFLKLVTFVLAMEADIILTLSDRWGKSPSELYGKIVWIVGASSGIGEHLAYNLAHHGCKLILSARREAKLIKIKQKCIDTEKIAQDDILVLPMDVVDLTSHKANVEKVIKHFGKIDILVNNAGRTQRAAWEAIDIKVDKEMFDVNVFGLVALTRAVLPHFLSNKSGHVVTMSSVAGKIGAPGSATYTATKHALHGYMEALRWEKGKDNIEVTMLCPGPVQTDLLESAFTENIDQTVNEKWNLEDNRMCAARCAHFCAVAIANKLEEAWITTQPILLLMYFAQYLPIVTHKLGAMLGFKVIQKLRDGTAAEKVNEPKTES